MIEPFKKNIIYSTKILSDLDINLIDAIKDKFSLSCLKTLLSNSFSIECIDDPEIISSYSRDYSNIDGYADFLVRPCTSRECAIILRLCTKYNFNLTISAGKTNLTGSATPNGGVLLSIERLNEYKIKIYRNKMTVSCSPNEYLESLREYILDKSNGQLYYPVDPTSRVDAMVSGTISCNASGFVPGKKGATRYWVNSIDVILTSGYCIRIDRGQYISKNGKFIISQGEKEIEIKIPSYNRPKIKNASGPFTCSYGEIDFIDLIIGSEGIFGLISRCELKLAKVPSSYIDLFVSLEKEQDALSFHASIGKILNNDYGKISALEYFGYNCSPFMKNRDYLFKSDDSVGVYLQIPLYGITYDEGLEEWYQKLDDFDINIDFDRVLVLKEPKHWKLFFEARHSLPENALKRAKELNTISIITDTIVPPQYFSRYLLFVHNLLQTNKIEYLLFGHLGDCHLHFHLLPSKDKESLAIELYNLIVKESSKLGGVYSAEHGTGKRKRSDFLECYGPKAASELLSTKKVFDPSLILNIGNVINI